MWLFSHKFCLLFSEFHFEPHISGFSPIILILFLILKLNIFPGNFDWLSKHSDFWAQNVDFFLVLLTFWLQNLTFYPRIWFESSKFCLFISKSDFIPPKFRLFLPPLTQNCNCIILKCRFFVSKFWPFFSFLISIFFVPPRFNCIISKCRIFVSKFWLYPEVWLKNLKMLTVQLMTFTF